MLSTGSYQEVYLCISRDVLVPLFALSPLGELDNAREDYAKRRCTNYLDRLISEKN